MVSLLFGGLATFGGSFLLGGSLLSGGGRYFRDLLAATKNGRYFRGVATFGGSLLSELYGIFLPFTSLQTIPLIDSFLADSFLGQSTGPFIPSGASQPMGIFRSLRERKKLFWGAFRAGATSSLFCRAL